MPCISRLFILSTLRAAPYTLKPACCNKTAADSPIQDDAPVISATFLFIVFFLCYY